MDQTTLILDRPLDGVARITLDRPPVNALGRDLVKDLTTVAEHVADDRALRCVLVAAKGKAFCAGADLKERRGMSEQEVEETVGAIGAATAAVAAIPVPTIAVIGGAALGGGLELALACDLRVAASGVKVGLPECSLAIVPGAGGTQRLARIAGPSVAKRWILGARIGTAEEAHADGFVDRVATAVDLDREAVELAREIARCGPVALRAAKRAIDAGLDADDLHRGLEIEREAYRLVLPTKDRVEALEAFAEKRPPRFEGR